ncbi:DUF6928 family protein [Kutzneria buriramensis]|nr:hypothetical protein [Kutzneria buriramensis]
MGAKTAMLVSADRPVAEALQGISEVDLDRAAELLSRLRPGSTVTATPPAALFDATYPAEGEVYALSAPGLDMLCDRTVMLDRPSELPERLLALGRGRRTYLHAMHSMVDWLAFAVWEDGRLARSLSVSPDDGVIEDIGDRLPFERPYWEGEHAVDDYPLPFHPLELGERALYEFFGFFLEGFRTLDGKLAEPLVDDERVVMSGFRC